MQRVLNINVEYKVDRWRLGGMLGVSDTMEDFEKYVKETLAHELAMKILEAIESKDIKFVKDVPKLQDVYPNIKYKLSLMVSSPETWREEIYNKARELSQRRLDGSSYI